MVAISSANIIFVITILVKLCTSSPFSCIGCSINKGNMPRRTSNNQRVRPTNSIIKSWFSPKELSILEKKLKPSADIKIKSDANKVKAVVKNINVNIPESLENGDKLSGKLVQANKISRNNALNPFLRVRREICLTQGGLPDSLSQLNQKLNSTQFIGLIPSSSPKADIPAGQPDTCPSVNEWPGSTVNLQSTCPWVYNETDLGENAYPRFIREAKCICPTCIGTSGPRCLPITQSFSYFIIQSCQDGLALMNQVTTQITVGCHCAGAQGTKPTTTTPRATPRNRPTLSK